tara:strand:+ start:2360 stop:2959 length:600 start_codon:yes stop_codon:yes gene_type:complete
MAHKPYIQKKQKSSKSGQLRIIGGRWRGTKLPVINTIGLRPTPDRVRETLFNWLAADLYNTRCLDLFAGSGVLGLEALSRGAKLCQFVEQSTSVYKQLEIQLEKLGASSAQLDNTDALNWLNNVPHQLFDIVFIDPPYCKGLAASACKLLLEKNWLTSNAMIYLEMGCDEQTPEILENWDLWREKLAGQVCYRLYRKFQ